jgi:hypothetical protein
VLCHKALNQNKDTMDPADMIQFIVAAVNYLITIKAPQEEMLRHQFTADLCRAIMVTEPSKMHLSVGFNGPYLRVENCTAALATAIGDLELLRRSVKSSKDLYAHCEQNVFPSALEIAVSSQHATILKWQLAYMIHDAKSKPKTKNSGVVEASPAEAAVKNVIPAFKLAIRKFQADEGDVLFTALVTLTSLHLNISDIRGKDHHRIRQVWTEIYSLAAKFKSIELMYRVLHEFKTATGTADLCKLPKKLLDHSFDWCTLEMVTKFLEDHYLDPNQMHRGRTLVGHALKCQRQDIAELLLDHGADINAVGPGRGVTALWHAAEGCHYRKVFFLLSRGALPNFPDHPFKSPLRRAKKGSYNKTLFLLKLGMTEEGRAKVRDEGLEVMDRYKECFRKQLRKERYKTKASKPT